MLAALDCDDGALRAVASIAGTVGMFMHARKFETISMSTGATHPSPFTSYHVDADGGFPASKRDWDSLIVSWIAMASALLIVRSPFTSYGSRWFCHDFPRGFIVLHATIVDTFDVVLDTGIREMLLDWPAVFVFAEEGRVIAAEDVVIIGMTITESSRVNALVPASSSTTIVCDVVVESVPIACHERLRAVYDVGAFD